MSSKTTLVQDLEAKPQSRRRDRLIQLARRGHFHDFETSLATPKIELRNALLALGFDDLAQKTIEGAYDDDPSNGARA